MPSATLRHSVAVVGAVFRDDGRVLAIQRRDTGEWQPPGGVLELAETFEEGVKREVLEETGISVDVERLAGVYKNIPGRIVALVFRCRPLTGSAQPSDEAAAVRWLTLTEAADLMDPAHAVRITDALLDTPTSRAHDGTHVLTV
ncbi:MAG: NUDIX hydrolase [Actinobacteria bacterium]|nr:NUDIX hydrolase [Actinomycetota bacterium]